MSHVIGNERCPACAKLGKDRHGDNLAIYDDGGAYCFSCGYYHPGARKTGSEGPRSAPETVSYLPHDVTVELPPKALLWLRDYCITQRDVVEHRILWSPSWERLIFPVGNCWQGRYFGNDQKAKWFTRGDIHNVMHVLGGDHGTSLVLVEDIVSAIRVSRSHTVAPLFGSDLPHSWYSRLRLISPRITLWLDFDKRVHSVALAMRLRNLGFDTQVVVTQEDPKCLDDVNICKELLTSS